MKDKIIKFITNNHILFIFIISFLGVVGSLFFSEVLNLEPCKLCWYQRIFLYPIALLSGIAVVFRIQIRKIFIISLAFPGFLIAIFHYFTQMIYGKSDVSVCGGGVSCNFVDWNLFGFITIPFLSILSFFAILLIIITTYNLQKRIK